MITYEHALLLVQEASFGSTVSSSLVRRLYIRVIQHWLSPIVFTSSKVDCLLMPDLGRISWITYLFPIFFLVLASLDMMSALVLCSWGMCLNSA